MRKLGEAEADEVWSPAMLLHYPEGRHGGRFNAWRLEPTSLEVVSIGNGVISAREDWRAPGLRRSRDGQWEPWA